MIPSDSNLYGLLFTLRELDWVAKVLDVHQFLIDCVEDAAKIMREQQDDIHHFEDCV